MSELYNTWKGRGSKIEGLSSPMIGMIYKGVDKFFGKETVGILVEIHSQNDEGVLRTKDNKLISVDLLSLSIVINE
jgi:hypothetical protein